MCRLFVATLLLFVLAACGQPAEGGLIIHTADPALSFFVSVPPAAPDVVPSEEVGVAEPDPTPTPPCDLVKGNITRDGRKLYHVAGMPNYNQVKIDESAGEQFFCSTAEAEAAGWTRANN